MDPDQPTTCDPESEGFTTFYQAWYAFLYRAARARGLDHMAAEECAHDVLVRVHQDDVWRSVRNPSSYLRRAVHWEVDRRTRVQGSVVRLAEELAETHACEKERPDQTVIRWEVEKALVELIDGLPDRCAVVMRLVVEGFTQREIAERLGIRVSGVEKQVARGKRLLTERVSSFEDGGGESSLWFFTYEAAPRRPFENPKTKVDGR